MIAPPARARLLGAAVIVAALGNMVDTYDLVLFSVVRVASLKDLGLTGEAVTRDGLLLLNVQMLGMLAGGVLWGVVGDRRGRMSVLFGSIVLYSVANIVNALAHSVPVYAVCRLIAGIGLAGELGAGITLVAEILPRDRRGWGTMIVAAVGLLGAVTAVLVSRVVDWRTCYLVGGVAGLMLFVLRASVRESHLFARWRGEPLEHGNFLMLFRDRRRATRYLSCVLVGLPIWYVVGILITLAPEFGKELGVRGGLDAGIGIMLSYGGGAIGDVLSGSLSQLLRSRLKVLILFVSLYALCALVYHLLGGVAARSFYVIFFLLGVTSGFWVIAHHSVDAVSVVSHHHSRGRHYPGDAEIVTALWGERGSGRLLGAQMIGAGTVAKRIDVLATALHARMTVADVEALDLSYAPPFAPVYDPILIAATVLRKELENERTHGNPALPPTAQCLILTTANDDTKR